MIQVQNLCKRFPAPRGQLIDAVQGVSFTVAAGEVYGLLGPNGAGKTTTLRMVIGLLQPTSGQASIAGFDSRTQSDEVKRRVGIVSATTAFTLGLPLVNTFCFSPICTVFLPSRPRRIYSDSVRCSILRGYSTNAASR